MKVSFNHRVRDIMGWKRSSAAEISGKAMQFARQFCKVPGKD